MGAWRQGPPPTEQQQQQQPSGGLDQVLGLLMSLRGDMQEVHDRLDCMQEEFDRRIGATERLCEAINRRFQ